MTAVSDVGAGSDCPRTSYHAMFRRSIWPIAALLPSLVVMRGMVATSEVYCFRELALIFLPAHRWIRNALAAGEAPLWDPYMALGQSGVAEPWRHVLFPPAMLLRLVPSEALGFNLWVGLPFPTAACGMYLLLRGRLLPSAAALGAVAFSVSSSMLSTGNMPNLSWSMAIAPWTIAAAAEAVRRRRVEWLALAAAVVGLQTLAGEPVTLAATIAVATTYAAIVAGDTVRLSVIGVAPVLVAVAIGCALGAVQYAPLLEAVHLSTRSAPNTSSFFIWSLHPVRLLEALVPFPFANAIATPPEYDSWTGVLSNGREPLLISHYLGVPALALAALGACTGDRRRAMFWLAVLGVAVACAVGSYTPIYPAAASAVPIVGMFRYPEKYALVAVLAVASLAAEGWNTLGQRQLSPRERWIVPIAVASLLASVAVADGLIPVVVRAVGAETLAAVHTRMMVAKAAPGLLATSLGVVLLVRSLARGSARRDVSLALGVGLVALDLVAAGYWLNPQIDAALLSEPSWVADAKASGGRFFTGTSVANGYASRAGKWTPEITEDPDAVNPLAAAPRDTPYYGQAALSAISTGVYESQWRLRGVFTVDAPRLLPREYHEFENRFFASPPSARAVALDNVGVRAQLRKTPPIGDGWTSEPVEHVGSARMYVSGRPFERVFVAPTTRVEPSSSTLNALFDEAFDLHAVALVDRGVPSTGAAPASSPASVEVLEASANALHVRADGTDGSTLVVLESFNPGWRVEVDGASAEVVRVDGLFLGVRLSEGRHDVRWRFQPRSFVAGSAITGSAALLLLAASAASIVRRRVSSRRAAV